MPITNPAISDTGLVTPDILRRKPQPSPGIFTTPTFDAGIFTPNFGKDVLVANCWTMDIDRFNGPIVFQKLDGLKRETKMTSVVDGGSGLTRKFSTGELNFGDLTLTRVRDGSQLDDAFYHYISYYFSGNGPLTKDRFVARNGVFHKYHRGNMVREIRFIRLQPISESWPTYDLKSEAPEELTYSFAVDYFYETRKTG